MPTVLSVARDQRIRSQTFRLNYDQTLSPTLLLHLGAGVQYYHNPDTSPPVSTDFDAAGQLGLKGAPGTGFPRIGVLGNDTYGGMTLAIGPTNRGLYVVSKPTGVAQVTWVHENHTYKAGGEWKIDSFTNKSEIGLSPSLGFGGGVTGQPLYGQALPSGTTIGNSFATFLLGQFDSGSVGNATDPQYRKSSWGVFVQDTWKVTRKLTLDYGIRYDLQKPERELWRRTSTFRGDVVNPNANGRLGGVLYEGTGTGRCNCTLVPTYLYAVAPRLGLAYQIAPRTVLRAGWGLAYSSTTAFNYIGAGNSQGMGYNTVNFTAPQSGVPYGKLSDGLQYDRAALYTASYNPGLLVVPGAAVQGSPSNVDPNGGRPPRINQWNLSLQREVITGLVAEAAYVGNRAAWLQGAGALVNYNTLTPETYRALNIDITNATDRTLLTSTITSAVAVARGFKKPYANFPDSGTVLQSLKPFPQYSGVGSTWTPLGHSWYDSLQVKVTKRTTHGLDATLAYAFAKTLNNFNGNGNILNRGDFKSLDPNDRRHLATISINYLTPAFGLVKNSRIARAALAGWSIGSVLQYQSGPLLATPGSTNSIGTYYPGSSSRQFRVPGQPLYQKDINGKIDPTQDIVLNPAAWSDQTTGVWGSRSTASAGSSAFGRSFSISSTAWKWFPIPRPGALRILRRGVTAC
ncbi:MAG: TonB-dependent receptor [Candidatus Solibacter sp.]|nr:TonB-dependent receptor [Candidatus Solibacter sp.]